MKYTFGFLKLFNEVRIPCQRFFFSASIFSKIEFIHAPKGSEKKQRHARRKNANIQDDCFCYYHNASTPGYRWVWV